MMRRLEITRNLGLFHILIMILKKLPCSFFQQDIYFPNIFEELEPSNESNNNVEKESNILKCLPSLSPDIYTLICTEITEIADVTITLFSIININTMFTAIKICIIHSNYIN
jgi:hypothetical protein